MLGRYGPLSGDLPRITLAVLAGILLYFAWMDLILYNRLQSLQPLHLPTVPFRNESGLASVSVSAQGSLPQTISGQVTGDPMDPHKQMGSQDTSIFSPFSGLSVKLMMMDHVNHYLENPVALTITKVFHLGTQFLWITPNLLSFLGVVLALLAARCISWDGRCWHLSALALMLGRGLMDALDGLVARERKGIIQHLSLHNTTGFFVDGVADALGFTAFLIGCFVYLRRNVPKHYQSLPVLYQGEEKPKRSSEFSGVNLHNNTQWTSQRIFLVVFCLGLQITVSAGLWDHYCTAYHQLLETPRASESQAKVQNEVLKSTLMWIVIWLWRIANAHALLNWLLFAILINKMWEFLLFIQFIGFAVIISLFLFTEIHFRDVTAYVNSVP